MVSRTFFGQATLTVASNEIGVSRSTGRRILDAGMEQLKTWLEEGYEPAEPDGEYIQVGSYVEDERRPVEILTESELEAVVNGRYRGDGRRLDMYVAGDPLGFMPGAGRCS